MQRQRLKVNARMRQFQAVADADRAGFGLAQRRQQGHGDPLRKHEAGDAGNHRQSMSPSSQELP